MLTCLHIYVICRFCVSIDMQSVDLCTNYIINSLRYIILLSTGRGTANAYNTVKLVLSHLIFIGLRVVTRQQARQI